MELESSGGVGRGQRPGTQSGLVMPGRAGRYSSEEKSGHAVVDSGPDSTLG